MRRALTPPLILPRSSSSQLPLHTTHVRSCLAYKQEERLDVAAAAAHPYLSVKSRERRQSVSGREAVQPTC